LTPSSRSKPDSLNSYNASSGAFSSLGFADEGFAASAGFSDFTGSAFFSCCFTYSYFYSGFFSFSEGLCSSSFLVGFSSTFFSCGFSSAFFSYGFSSVFLAFFKVVFSTFFYAGFFSFYYGFCFSSFFSILASPVVSSIISPSSSSGFFSLEAATAPSRSLITSLSLSPFSVAKDCLV
jgi:hypothetical protein